MHNNGLGFLVQDEWFKIPGHYSNVSLDVFTTMPNHLHGILALHSLVKKSDKPEARSLSSVVGNFKSGVSRKARQLKLHDVGMIFQPRFYDHSIRHERALERVREYILNNPAKWSLDRENSLREGLDPFYEWIEAYSQHISPARTR